MKTDTNALLYNTNIRYYITITYNFDFIGVDQEVRSFILYDSRVNRNDGAHLLHTADSYAMQSLFNDKTFYLQLECIN